MRPWALALILAAGLLSVGATEHDTTTTTTMTEAPTTSTSTTTTTTTEAPTTATSSTSTTTSTSTTSTVPPELVVAEETREVLELGLAFLVFVAFALLAQLGQGRY